MNQELKLQKHRTRKVGDKDYFKWELVIPNDVVKVLGWDDNIELESRARNGKLVIDIKPQPVKRVIK